MRLFQMLAILFAAITLSACEPETYPISGEECGPNDPVQELDATNCLPPV